MTRYPRRHAKAQPRRILTCFTLLASCVRSRVRSAFSIDDQEEPNVPTLSTKSSHLSSSRNHHHDCEPNDHVPMLVYLRIPHKTDLVRAINSWRVLKRFPQIPALLLLSTCAVRVLPSLYAYSYRQDVHWRQVDRRTYIYRN